MSLRGWGPLLVVVAVACSSREGGQCPSPSPGAVAVAAASTDAPVSFRREVVPLLQGSCAFSSCHGVGRALVLGDKQGRVGPEEVRAALVAVPSATLPSMAFVTEYDPSQSFLQKKIDGEQCALDDLCDGRDCGDPMPPDGAPLSADDRDLLRRWIAQGAKDDGASPP